MPSEIIVIYDRAAQDIRPLREAAYRLIGVSSCQIGGGETQYRCTLTLNEEAERIGWTTASVAEKFRDLVTDENLRQQIAFQTKDVKNVIVALAFGALAAQEKRPD